MGVFVEIARRGSLTAAAKSLGKSLPAVVRILATLEETLKVRLFNRTTRRIALTEEGRFYLEHCRRILAAVEDAELSLGRRQAEPAGTITLTAPVRFGELHIAPIAVMYLAQHPKVDVKLFLLDRIVDLLEEGIDVAVRIAHLKDSTLIARRVGEVREVVCASPALLRRVGRPELPRDLASLPCVRFLGLSTNPTWSFGDGSEVALSPRLSCNHAGASLEACVAGLSFGRFLSYQVMPAVRAGALEIVLADFEPRPTPVHLVTPPNRLPSARVRSFVDWLATRVSASLEEAGKAGLRATRPRDARRAPRESPRKPHGAHR
jgi:DNA-binding transcriptional LysR family regulator